MSLLLASAGLRFTAEAVLYSTGFTCIYSLAATQFLVLSAYVTPNQDLAFVLGISYVTVACLVGGYLVRLPDMVRFLPVCLFNNHTDASPLARYKS